MKTNYRLPRLILNPFCFVFVFVFFTQQPLPRTFLELGEGTSIDVFGINTTYPVEDTRRGKPYPIQWHIPV